MFFVEQIRILQQILRDVHFSNSLHGKREIFSIFVFFAFFFGIALILASEKKEKKERRKKKKRKLGYFNRYATDGLTV